MTGYLNMSIIRLGLHIGRAAYDVYKEGEAKDEFIRKGQYWKAYFDNLLKDDPKGEKLSLPPPMDDAGQRVFHVYRGRVFLNRGDAQNAATEYLFAVNEIIQYAEPKDAQIILADLEMHRWAGANHYVERLDTVARKYVDTIFPTAETAVKPDVFFNAKEESIIIAGMVGTIGAGIGGMIGMGIGGPVAAYALAGIGGVGAGLMSYKFFNVFVQTKTSSEGGPEIQQTKDAPVAQHSESVKAETPLPAYLAEVEKPKEVVTHKPETVARVASVKKEKPQEDFSQIEEIVKEEAKEKV